MPRFAARSTRHLVCSMLASLLASIATVEAQELFKTPEDAASALVAAARDSNLRRLYSILGANGPKIVSSGDLVADAADRQRFASAYDNRHSIKEQGNSATLLIGQDEFPFAIPLVRAFGHWKFDTQAGYREIRLRRIGRNEGLDQLERRCMRLAAKRTGASQVTNRPESVNAAACGSELTGASFHSLSEISQAGSPELHNAVPDSNPSFVPLTPSAARIIEAIDLFSGLMLRSRLPRWLVRQRQPCRHM